MSKPNEEFGRLLGRLIRGAGLTRLQISTEAGIERSYVTLMTQQGVVPRREKLVRIAASLRKRGATVEDLAMLFFCAGYMPDCSEVRQRQIARLLGIAPFGQRVEELVERACEVVAWGASSCGQLAEKIHLLHESLQRLAQPPEAAIFFADEVEEDPSSKGDADEPR